MKFTKRQSNAYLHTFLKAESIEFLQSGSGFFDTLVSVIDSATKSLHIQMYIINDDEIGREIQNALLNAANRGVEINIIADGFGSRSLSQPYVETLIHAGINFRFFSRISLFKNLTIGRRLHHKIIVADAYTALIGGINIADKYHGSKDENAWLDFALLIKGTVCQKIEKICNLIEEKKYSFTRIKNHIRESFIHPTRISIRQNDWLRNKSQIFSSYKLAFQNAEKSILIFGSYFLPGIRLRRALEAAAKRGVQITIVLAGMTDIPPILNATPFLYHWLLKNNIRVFEWKKSVLHAKLAVIDDQWMTIGSFNLNHLSTYASIELNIDILNSQFTKQSRLLLEKLIAEGCEEITINRKHSIYNRISEAIAYFLGRTLIKTITIFPNFRNYYSKTMD
jgi:cardiolipin synthase